MKYLHGTVSIPLMLEADQSNNLYWWVDGAFANYDDMWSHTGGALSLVTEFHPSQRGEQFKAPC